MTLVRPIMVGHITAGFHATQFSYDSLLIVPGLKGSFPKVDVISAPLSDIPTELCSFRELCDGASKANPLLNIPTKWGQAWLDDHAEMQILAHGGDSGLKKRIGLSMGNGEITEDDKLSHHKFVQAVLHYESIDSQFIVRQIARMQVSSRDEKLVAKSANGIGGIAIAAGVELIKTALHLKTKRNGLDSDEGESWINIAGSLGLMEDGLAGSGKITPCTALYLSELFRKELGLDREAYTFKDGEARDDPRVSNWVKTPELHDSDELDGFEKEVRFETDQVIREQSWYVPPKIEEHEPRFSVRYIPNASESGVFDDDEGTIYIDSPVVEIRQSTLLSPSGAEPFAEVVADLLLAAKHMYSDFPLWVP